MPDAGQMSGPMGRLQLCVTSGLGGAGQMAPIATIPQLFQNTRVTHVPRHILLCLPSKLPDTRAIVKLGSRCLVRLGVSKNPTDACVTERLRETTPFGEGPRHLIRGNDGKHGVFI